MTSENTPMVPPARIAFILDGVVQDVLNTDDRLAAIFLSQPKIVDVTEISESEFITSGYLYDEVSNTFTRPEVSVETTPVPSDVVTVPIVREEAPSVE